MYDLEKYKGKEIIVRKRIAGFIEKLFKAYNYDFHHDRFKKVVYGEDACNCLLEEKFKSYYDGYWFLLSNSKNSLSNENQRQLQKADNQHTRNMLLLSLK